MQQSAGDKRPRFRFRDLEQLAHLCRIDLRPPHVAMSRLVFRVNCDRQRFDRVHVQIRNLFDVLQLFSLRSLHFANSLLIEAVEKMHQHNDQRANE